MMQSGHLTLKYYTQFFFFNGNYLIVIMYSSIVIRAAKRKSGPGENLNAGPWKSKKKTHTSCLQKWVCVSKKCININFKQLKNPGSPKKFRVRGAFKRQNIIIFPEFMWRCIIHSHFQIVFSCGVLLNYLFTICVSRKFTFSNKYLHNLFLAQCKGRKRSNF